MIKRAKIHHAAISVDIDRFDDRHIRLHYLEFFEANGTARNVDDVRRLCAAAREKGLEVFPPCDNTGPDGACLGHDDPDAQSIAEVP